MGKKLKKLGKSLEQALKNNTEVVKLAKAVASTVTEKVDAENGRFQARLERLADKAQAAAAGESQASAAAEDAVDLQVASLLAAGVDAQDLQDDEVLGLTQEIGALQAGCPFCDDGGPQMHAAAAAAAPVGLVGASQSDFHSCA